MHKRLVRVTFLLSLSIFLGTTLHTQNAKAFDDFVCPDGFVCPEEIMPDVAFWVKAYGETDKNHALIFNYNTREVYETVDTQGECEKNSAIPLAAKARIASEKGLKTDEIKYKCGMKDLFLSGLPFYKEHKDYIVQSLQNTKYTTSNNETRTLPLAIQYLPFAESAYNPFAVSSTKAVGTWQFMPETGKGFGLTVTSAVDERRDPIKSTDAAMKYMARAFKDIYSTACSINPNPDHAAIGPIAMIGYIYGIAGAQKAVQSCNSINFVDVRQYKGSAFGDSTRKYYPIFLANYYVGTHEVDFFGDIVQPKEKVSTQTLALQRALKAKSLVRPFEYDINEMKYLASNYKYTELVWSGIKAIPAKNTFEVPLMEEPVNLSKYVKVVSTNIPLKREENKIEPLKPRAVKLEVPVQNKEIILQKTYPLVPADSTKQKSRVNRVLKNLFNNQ